jgi:hypothetical protein
MKLLKPEAMGLDQLNDMDVFELNSFFYLSLRRPPLPCLRCLPAASDAALAAEGGPRAQHQCRPLVWAIAHGPCLRALCERGADIAPEWAPPRGLRALVGGRRSRGGIAHGPLVWAMGTGPHQGLGRGLGDAVAPPLPLAGGPRD